MFRVKVKRSLANLVVTRFTYYVLIYIFASYNLHFIPSKLFPSFLLDRYFFSYYSVLIITIIMIIGLGQRGSITIKKIYSNYIDVSPKISPLSGQ